MVAKKNGSATPLPEVWSARIPADCHVGGVISGRDGMISQLDAGKIFVTQSVRALDPQHVIQRTVMRPGSRVRKESYPHFWDDVVFDAMVGNFPGQGSEIVPVVFHGYYKPPKGTATVDAVSTLRTALQEYVHTAEARWADEQQKRKPAGEGQ